MLNPDSLKTSKKEIDKDLMDNDGTYSEITNRYIKIPYYYNRNTGSGGMFGPLRAIDDDICTGNSDSEGRMFLVADEYYTDKALFICINGNVKEISFVGRPTVSVSDDSFSDIDSDFD